MAERSAEDIVLHLARYMKDRRTCPTMLSQSTGIPLYRFTMIQLGKWEELTIREIATISQALDIDLPALITGRSTIA
jgi:DNA-binding Xre family transcriptional regulator